MNARTVYSVGEALKLHDLQKRLNSSSPDLNAVWRASERLENVRGVLVVGHNRLINLRTAALYRGREDIAEAIKLGADLAREALGIVLGDDLKCV